LLKINKITNLTKYHVYSFFGDAQHLPTTHPTLIEGQVAELIDSVVLANGPLFAAQTTRIRYYKHHDKDYLRNDWID